MPGLVYEVAKAVIKEVGHRELYAMNLPDALAFIEENDGKQDRLPPEWFSARYNICTRESLGSPVYVIEPKTGLLKRRLRADAPVVLFIHGGAFMFAAQTAHWIALDKIIRKTGATVWFCVYPLLPQGTIYEASTVVFDTYVQMLETYGEGRITVVGDSAGAVLSLNLAHWIRKPQIDLPQPKKIVLVSPAQILVNDEELRAQMEALNSVDVMLNTNVIDLLANLMPARKGYDDFYELQLEGDFFKFPPLVVFAGTYDVLYPLIAGFLLRVRGSGVPLAYYEGRGLCHCWPYVPFVPECEQGLRQLIRAIE